MPRRPPAEGKYALLARILDRTLGDPFPKDKRIKDIAALMAKSEKNSSSYFPNPPFTEGEMNLLMDSISDTFSERYKGRKGEKIGDTISPKKMEIQDLKREGNTPPAKSYLKLFEGHLREIEILRDSAKEVVKDAGFEGPKASKVVEATEASPEMAVDLAFVADVMTAPRDLAHLNTALARYYTVAAGITYKQSKYTSRGKGEYVDTVERLLRKLPDRISEEDSLRLNGLVDLLQGIDVKDWKIIGSSPHLFDCLIHSFLLSTSTNFQRMPNENERNRAASALRRIILPQILSNPIDGIPAEDRRRSLSKLPREYVFLESEEINALCHIYGISIAVFSSPQKIHGVLQSIVLQRFNEELEGPIFCISNVGNAHYEAVEPRGLRGNPFIIDKATYDFVYSLLNPVEEATCPFQARQRVQYTYKNAEGGDVSTPAYIMTRIFGDRPKCIGVFIAPSLAIVESYIRRTTHVPGGPPVESEAAVQAELVAADSAILIERAQFGQLTPLYGNAAGGGKRRSSRRRTRNRRMRKTRRGLYRTRRRLRRRI